MSVSTEMPIRNVKQIRNQLIMCSVFLSMFVPLLIKFVEAIPLLQQTPGNMVFAAGATCLIVLLVALSGWYWILFAIHVRSVTENADGITIGRIFARAVRIPQKSVFRKKILPVPSSVLPGYKHGTLFIFGASSFYVSNDLPNARSLIESLSASGIAK